MVESQWSTVEEYDRDLIKNEGGTTSWQNFYDSFWLMISDVLGLTNESRRTIAASRLATMLATSSATLFRPGDPSSSAAVAASAAASTDNDSAPERPLSGKKLSPGAPALELFG